MRGTTDDIPDPEQPRGHEADHGPMLLCVPDDPQRSIEDTAAEHRSRGVVDDQILDWVATTAYTEGWR
jgi:hypothetical protein